MAQQIIKLYRGLSSQEFSLATTDLLKQNKQSWSSIIVRRAKGDFKYPQSLHRDISKLHNNLRLEHQYFTDSKSIAEGYARKVEGLLVELQVPVKDVLHHFDLEFQNFARRKKQFEVVYCVKGSTLEKFRKKWKLKLAKKS